MKGEKNHRAKLTNDQVKAVRQSAKPVKQICKELQMSKSAIYAIKSGDAWTHVD